MFVDEVEVKCSSQCPYVGRSFWVTKIDTIFEIVDDIVSGDFMLLWSKYKYETRESLQLLNIVFNIQATLNLNTLAHLMIIYQAKTNTTCSQYGWLILSETMSTYITIRITRHISYQMTTI